MEMFKLLVPFFRFGTLQHRWSRGILCLAWAASIFLPFPLFAASQAPQVPPEIVEQFRMASEAMRAGNIDAAGGSLAGRGKKNPNFSRGVLNLGPVPLGTGRPGRSNLDFHKAFALKSSLR